MAVKEEWKPVVGYEGRYEISSAGRVYSHVSGKMLKPWCSPKARRVQLQVFLFTADGARKPRLVHRLVLEAFVGPCPEGMQACHFNDVPDDNRLLNLRWDMSSANKFDEVRNGKHAHARKTHCKRGHEFSPANTHIGHKGQRVCRTCDNERRRVTA